MAREARVQGKNGRGSKASSARSRQPDPVVVAPARPRNQRAAKRAPEPSGPGATRQAATRLVAFVRAQLVRFRRPGVIVLRGLLILASLAGAAAIGRLLQHHLTTSRSFAIDRIDLGGAARLEREEVLEAAGIDVGTNVFLHSPEEVKARLLRHPWIASAEVQRRLPSRFTLTIRERQPVALLSVEACTAVPRALDEEAAERTEAAAEPCGDDDESSIYLVSDEATVFKRLDGEDPIDLPVITGITRTRLAEDPDAVRRLLVESVLLLSEYRAVGLAHALPIGELHLGVSDEVALYVGDELTHVRLGFPPFAPKLRRMKKVFDRLGREHASAEYVYLDNELRPDRVTVRLRARGL